MPGSFLVDDLDTFFSVDEFASSVSWLRAEVIQGSFNCLIDDGIDSNDSYNKEIGSQTVSITGKRSDMATLQVNDVLRVVDSISGIVDYVVDSLPTIAGFASEVLNVATRSFFWDSAVLTRTTGSSLNPVTEAITEVNTDYDIKINFSSESGSVLYTERLEFRGDGKKAFIYNSDSSIGVLGTDKITFGSDTYRIVDYKTMDNGDGNVFEIWIN